MMECDIPQEKRDIVDSLERITEEFNRIDDMLHTEKPMKSRLVYSACIDEVRKSKFHIRRLRHWVIHEAEMPQDGVRND